MHKVIYYLVIYHVPFMVLVKKNHKRLFELVVQVLAFFLRGCKQSNPSSVSKSAAKLLLFFDICKYISKKMRVLGTCGVVKKAVILQRENL